LQRATSNETVIFAWQVLAYLGGIKSAFKDTKCFARETMNGDISGSEDDEY
jgi:hypothetical protein